MRSCGISVKGTPEGAHVFDLVAASIPGLERPAAKVRWWIEHAILTFGYARAWRLARLLAEKAAHAENPPGWAMWAADQTIGRWLPDQEFEMALRDAAHEQRRQRRAMLVPLEVGRVTEPERLQPYEWIRGLEAC